MRLLHSVAYKTMQNYRKKPVVIQAVQYNENNMIPLTSMLQEQNVNNQSIGVDDGIAWIDTLEGRMTISDGDWLIRGVNGEYYPCKPDIFEKTYELID